MNASRGSDLLSLPPALQRAGDNVLAVTAHLAGLADLVGGDSAGDIAGGNLVFFDVLGLFVVSYPFLLGALVNAL